MHVSQLRLQDFRSYPVAELELEPGPVVLLGNNGQGKTNLLEAIGYFATHASHRVANDQPLIRVGAERAIIQAKVIRSGRAASIELEINCNRGNRTRINGGKPLPARNSLGILHSVLFAPEDLALVRSDPGHRRKFLDSLLVQLSPRSSSLLADYDRILKQRNALLKVVRLNPAASQVAQLEIWDQQLLASGRAIVELRKALITALLDPVQKGYHEISGTTDEIELVYHQKEPEAFEVDSMGYLHAAEVARGTTLAGPHLDDLGLSLGGLPAKGYASHGEAWSLALALRLSSYELLSGRVDLAEDSLLFSPMELDYTKPILVLDDVFAELDEVRRLRLSQLLQDSDQVFVSSATIEAVPALFQGQKFVVTKGQVTSG